MGGASDATETLQKQELKCGWIGVLSLTREYTEYESEKLKAN